jgi:hypothetical protein
MDALDIDFGQNQKDQDKSQRRIEPQEMNKGINEEEGGFLIVVKVVDCAAQ